MYLCEVNSLFGKGGIDISVQNELSRTVMRQEEARIQELKERKRRIMVVDRSYNWKPTTLETTFKI